MSYGEHDGWHYWRECHACGCAGVHYLHCLHDHIQSSCVRCGVPLPFADGDCDCEFWPETPQAAIEAEHVRTLVEVRDYLVILCGAITISSQAAQSIEDEFVEHFSVALDARPHRSEIPSEKT